MPGVGENLQDHYMTGARYRLIGLTPEEARELARMLAKAADIVTLAASQHRPGPGCR